MATKRLWRWRGIDVQGAPCQGMLWQTKRLEVLQHLQQQRVIPLAVRRCAVKQSLWHPRYSCETIRQLATLLQAGLPLAEGLSLLAQQQSHAQWQALLEALGRELAQGVAFSAALAQWPQAFPPLYLAMISTGELTGKLDICCLQLANQQQEQQRLASKVKKALRYPLIVLSLALLVVLGMLYFVLPGFTAIYQTFSTPLPLLTRMVVAAGDMLSRGWPLLLASLLSPLLLNQLIRRRSDWLLRRQRLLNALPLIGSLIGGQQLSLIFTILALSRCGGFTPLCLQLIRTGESAGALDQMLENLAHHHRQQTYQRADSLAAHLEPMMLVITGSLVGILVVAMYLPVFHLGDAIGGAGG
ncbi:type II secretion system F family protein [Klebsiella pneumoniae]|uniref:type II secretion system F family protein n=1 Tax=Klebsiella pneumoniae TaxID=573 RepID=UPI0021E0D2D1|nr:type II secretion system F family protein [Klebsiella pneumoniae]MCB4197655.1 type II secretion system F family protein [Klebsiella pneumoniae]MCF0493808.1 type II secretion system F family protein [Klebsiella pneumoniae]MCF0586383.1 type II secretion system F family protein [Klebsiella pneumoniae]MCF0597841.1 type II secretion system F family protein [Klebsiella pneumoniae]MCF0620055.1 type II secretion system F family protein [Klebsiella pneumoniae]